MTSISAVAPLHCAQITGPAVATVPSTECPIWLPQPLIGGAEPCDCMSMMMAAVERMSAMSSDESLRQIQANQGKLDKALDKFMDKIKEALEAERKASHKTKHKRKGLFGKITGAIAHTCAKIIGAAVDFAKDLVEAPFEIGYSMAKNGGNPVKAFKSALAEQFKELSNNGNWAKSVQEFTQGVILFTADVSAFAVSCIPVVNTITNGGEMPSFDKLKENATNLYNSLSENILQNEGFWDVIEPIAKAAAVASAAFSGGALAPIALGVMALLEVNAHTDFLGSAFGQEAGQWVALGLSVGCGLLAGFGESPSQIAKIATRMSTATKALGGLATLDQGRLELAQAKLDRNCAIKNTEVQETLQRIRMLHDIADELVEAYSDVSDGRQTNQALFQSLMQSEISAESAAIFRA